jgi:DNA-binding transcriptional LysR family regulator
MKPPRPAAGAALHGFDWDHLKAFLAVARTGKLTAAARRLATDHATVARKIAALEGKLRARLFDRSPRGYALAPGGEKLLALAEEIETLALAAAERAGGEAGAIAGAVRIGAPEGFGSYFLAPRLARLIDRHPALNVELVASPSVLSLSRREADLVVALSKPKGGRLYARKLVDFELGLFATADYLASIPPIARRDDLVHARFIGYISDLIYAPELDYIRDIHPDIGAAIESSNLVAQLRAALAGAGLCILPAFIARLHEELMPVLAADIRLTRTLHLIAHADTRALERVRAAADFLVAETAAARSLFALAGAP